MPKILIVEDSEDTRESLAARLQCRGFEVIVTRDGKLGVTMVQTEKPDLVLMDMHMPELDGWEAARQIKEGADDAPPVIALTERTMPTDREQALLAGCATSLDKPVELSELIAQIECLLTNRVIPEVPLIISSDPVQGEA
jgi:DNA-binding response OmpR family regulator